MAVSTASAFRPGRKQSVSGGVAPFADGSMPLMSPSPVPSMPPMFNGAGYSQQANGSGGSGRAAAASMSSSDGGIGSSLMMSGPGGAALMPGAPQAANNIGNKPAVAGSSLYQACLALRDRLWCVPGFGEAYLSESTLEPSPDGSAPLSGLASAPPSPKANAPPATRPIASSDPVTQLWQLFRLGAPLCALFNHLGPRTPLGINPDANRSNANECKKQVARFIIALQNELGWDPDDCFTVSQLYLNDTNGFVKVIRTISKLLDVFESRGLLVEPTNAPLSAVDELEKPTDDRAWIVRELLDTERKYVQDLEVMQNYARALGQNDILPPDTIHNLFGNLNTLVDVNRRFLICVEENVRRPADDQHFGHVFQTMESDFSVYEPFCANYAQALDIITAEAHNIQRLRGMPAAEGCYLDPSYELPTFLIKPVQRICKYPLLLEQLQKKTSPDAPFYQELVDGLQVIRRITDKVNETRRLQENIQIVRELELRVEDWKGHNIATLGPLLLSDVFQVAKGDTEREYHVYLFEKILLCCKEVLPAQVKKSSKSNSLLKTKTTAAQTPPGKKPKTTLQLKGRIFINNVTGAKAHVKSPSTAGAPFGAHALQVWWRGDIDQESFSLRCKNEEQLKQWMAAINKLIDEVNVRRQHVAAHYSQGAGISPGSFAGINGRRSTGGSSQGNYSHFPQTPLTEVAPGFPFMRTESQMSHRPRMESSEADSVDQFESRREGGADVPNFGGPNGRGTPVGRYSTPAEQRERQMSFSSADKPRARTEDQDSSLMTQWRSHSPAMPPPLPRTHTTSSGSAGAATAAAAVAAGEREHQLRKASSSRQLRQPGYPLLHANGGYPRPPRPAGEPQTPSDNGDMIEQLDQVQLRNRAGSSAHNMGRAQSDAGQQSRNRSASNPMAFNPTDMGPPPPVPRAPYPSHLVGANGEQQYPQNGQLRQPMDGSVDKRFSSSSASTLDSVHSLGSLRNSTAGSSPITQGGSSQGFSSTRSTTNTPTQAGHSNAIKLNVHFGEDRFVVVVLATIDLAGLIEKVTKKVRVISGRRLDGVALRVRYIDEDGDKILMHDDEDVQMAFELGRQAGADVELIVTAVA